MMNLDLDEWEARAEMCAEATIPGEMLRELSRLAKLGQTPAEQGTQYHGWVPPPGSGCQEC